MLLIVSMLFTLIPMVVFADDVPAGTALTSSSELYNMADNGVYYLANDIYIEGDWNYRATITGTTLDGNGYTIYYKDGVTIHGGLFREVNGITVKNLNIVQMGNMTYIGKDDGGEVSPLIRRVVGGTVTVTDVSVYANMKMVQANTADQGGGIVFIRFAAGDMFKIGTVGKPTLNGFKTGQMGTAVDGAFSCGIIVAGVAVPAFPAAC